MLRILILSQSFGDYLGDIKTNIIPTLAAFATQFLATLVLLIIVKVFYAVWEGKRPIMKVVREDSN